MMGLVKVLYNSLVCEHLQLVLQVSTFPTVFLH